MRCSKGRTYIQLNHGQFLRELASWASQQCSRAQGKDILGEINWSLWLPIDALNGLVTSITH